MEGKPDSGATILDVARLAGVSPSTVTHTLNGKRPIGQDTRERVLKAIETLGYVPSRSAQRLREGKSGIIGCLAVDITETFVNQIVRGVEKGLPGSRLTLLFASGVEFGRNFDEAFSFLKSHRIDGLLICHPFPIGQVRRPLETSARTPMVSINMRIPGMASVVPDNVRGGFQAAEHLYGAGMRRPAMIGGPAERLSVIDRLSGYRSRIAELGLELEERAVLFGEYSFEHGFAAAKRLMDERPGTDGIFCANDYIAAGAVARLREMGVEIPRQVRVVGFDNRDFSSFEPVPLTTFEQPLQEMGLLGIGLLRCAIDSGEPMDDEPTHVLQSKLIPRASTMGK